MVYYISCVVKGNVGVLIMVDMLFMIYGIIEVVLENVVELMCVGVYLVKLEGIDWMKDIIWVLSEWGVFVCVYFGLIF